jgi:ComF family protein
MSLPTRFAPPLDRLLGLLFPDRCVGCGRFGALFCAACRRTLQPYSGQLPRMPPLHSTAVAYIFDGPLRGALLGLKYQRQPRLAEPLAELLLAQLDRERRLAGALVPVPLSPSRLAERGYNQAELIAAALARRLELPLVSSGLTRVRATRSQVGLDSTARRQNVAGAFAWQHSRRPPAQAVLIDDVLTTGATLQACASALLAAGSQQVTALTVARSRPDLDAAARLNQALSKL